MNQSPVVIAGIGEIGSVFARAFLRTGHPVYPVTRQQTLSEVHELLPKPECVVLAVGETALPELLKQVPADWKDRLVLLQNELLPKDWSDFPDSTVISVWFEKKKGQDSKVILPSPVFGPCATILSTALESIDIAVNKLENEEQLLFELVLKNLYILTTNIAGLKTGGTVGELWEQHQTLARNIAEEVILLQQALTGKTFDTDLLITAMQKAFAGDPEHKCMGRSAPARLQRAVEQARHFQLQLPTIEAIFHEQQ